MIDEVLKTTRCCLMVVDVQNDFCHENGAFSRLGMDVRSVQQMVPRLLTLIKRTMAVGIPIIYIRTEHHPWTDSRVWTARNVVKKGAEIVPICQSGTWGTEFYKVSPTDKDYVITKHRYSAFYGTELDLILRSKEIESIILTGVSTNVCVETTARDAMMRDYRVILLEDCTATVSEEEHQAALNNVRKYFGMVCTSQEIFSVWEGKESVSRIGEKRIEINDD